MLVARSLRIAAATAAAKLGGGAKDEKEAASPVFVGVGTLPRGRPAKAGFGRSVVHTKTPAPPEFLDLDWVEGGAGRKKMAAPPAVMGGGALPSGQPVEARFFGSIRQWSDKN